MAPRATLLTSPGMDCGKPVEDGVEKAVDFLCKSWGQRDARFVHNAVDSPVDGPCVSPASIVERLWTPPLVSQFEMAPRSVQTGARQEQAERRNAGRMPDQSEIAHGLWIDSGKPLDCR
jgi:hypothetical protein